MPEGLPYFKKIDFPLAYWRNVPSGNEGQTIVNVRWLIVSYKCHLIHCKIRLSAPA